MKKEKRTKGKKDKKEKSKKWKKEKLILDIDNYMYLWYVSLNRSLFENQFFKIIKKNNLFKRE